MRAVGLDIHRDFCEVAIMESKELRSVGRVKTTPEDLELFAASLGPDDWVAFEVSGNAAEIARILEGHVARVVVVSPSDTGIRQARAKTREGLWIGGSPDRTVVGRQLQIAASREDQQLGPLLARWREGRQRGPVISRRHAAERKTVRPAARLRDSHIARLLPRGTPYVDGSDGHQPRTSHRPEALIRSLEGPKSRGPCLVIRAPRLARHPQRKDPQWPSASDSSSQGEPRSNTSRSTITLTSRAGHPTG